MVVAEIVKVVVAIPLGVREIDIGVNDGFVPAGRFVEERETVPPNAGFAWSVMVAEPLVPCATQMVDDVDEALKSGDAGLTA